MSDTPPEDEPREGMSGLADMREHVIALAREWIETGVIDPDMRADGPLFDEAIRSLSGELKAMLDGRDERFRSDLHDAASSCILPFRMPDGRDACAYGQVFVLPLTGRDTGLDALFRDDGTGPDGNAHGGPALVALARTFRETGLAHRTASVFLGDVLVTAEGLASVTYAGARRIATEFANVVFRSRSDDPLELVDRAIVEECAGSFGSRLALDPLSPSLTALALVGLRLLVVAAQDTAWPSDHFSTFAASPRFGLEGVRVEGEEPEDPEDVEAYGAIAAMEMMSDGIDPDLSRPVRSAVDDVQAAQDWLVAADAVLEPFGLKASLPCLPRKAAAILACGLLRRDIEAALVAANVHPHELADELDVRARQGWLDVSLAYGERWVGPVSVPSAIVVHDLSTVARYLESLAKPDARAKLRGDGSHRVQSR